MFPSWRSRRVADGQGCQIAGHFLLQVERTSEAALDLLAGTFVPGTGQFSTRFLGTKNLVQHSCCYSFDSFIRLRIFIIKAFRPIGTIRTLLYSF